jgi:hypothetical protein
MRVPASCRFAAVVILAGTSSSVHAQGTSNFQFTVEAEAGLKLAFSGYNASGERTFLERTSKRESYDGKQVYVVRVDESIILSGQVVMWCIQDLKEKWSLPAKFDKQPGDPLCVRNPKDDGKGSFNFKTG